MKKSTTVYMIGVLLLLMLLAPATSFAQSKVFFWRQWDIDITLRENGDMDVEERQTLDFSGDPFTYGFRSIVTGSAGNNEGITNVRVREGDRLYTEASNNAPGTFKITQEGSETFIYWYFEPTVGEHTYTFSYTIKGGVRVGTLDEGSGDQIYWTVIPDDHPARVQASRVTIRLPEGVAAQQYTDTTDYLVAAYTGGAEDGTVVIDVEENGRFITYERAFPLLVGDSFDVRVQFPHGLLNIPKPAWQSREERSDVAGTFILAIGVFLAVTGPLGVLVMWYARGRDPQVDLIVPEYLSEPPDDLPPAVIGTLVDEQADMSDIMSILLDLARRGYVTITEEERTHRFTRTDKNQKDLRPFEKSFLRALLGTKDERTLKEMNYSFAQHLPKIRKQLYEEIVSLKLVPRSPEAVRMRYAGLGAGIMVLGVASCLGMFLIFTDSEALGGAALCVGGALGLTGLMTIIAGRHMPKKTVLGTETAVKWNAFITYLKNIEKYSDLQTATDIFAKYLPYAVAFGLERTWIHKFEQIPTTPSPDWYTPYPYPRRSGWGGWWGGSSSGSSRSSTPTVPSGEQGGSGGLEGMSKGVTGGLSAMSAGLTQMLNNTATTLKSTPPSSSGGGSSGGFSGGFSGGSSGGGGSAGFG
ncbi:MAG: DUF2207 domain-containing protein [Chloroflexota bacterium]